jgi:hypothetical protein
MGIRCGGYEQRRVGAWFRTGAGSTVPRVHTISAAGARRKANGASGAQRPRQFTITVMGARPFWMSVEVSARIRPSLATS